MGKQVGLNCCIKKVNVLNCDLFFFHLFFFLPFSRLNVTGGLETCEEQAQNKTDADSFTLFIYRSCSKQSRGWDYETQVDLT